jgi:transposase
MSAQRRTEKKGQPTKGAALPVELQQVHLNAAGIDVGAEHHFAAVPVGRDQETVRQFGAYTEELYRLAEWLKQCDIDTVVMESTGVYWIPLFQVLQERGFEVKLVDPRRLKHVPGRKTDVLDCQWLQQLHTFGLLSGAFRPEDQVCVLRSYLRQRAMLVRYASHHIQHMQKALTQMNLKLQQVVEDITGMTGMQIIRAILAGERDPQRLAALRDYRCKHDAKTIAQALQGHWRPEHLFELRQAVELYDFYHQKIAECDQGIEGQLQALADRSDREPPPARHKQRARHHNAPLVDFHDHLFRVAGVDLTSIDGIDTYTALKLLSEIGVDMSPWPSAKHFASWLGLCPENKVSGGKVLSSKTKRSANRAAATLRLAAQGLRRSKTALGAYFRRKIAHLGTPKAITATAHKLARLVYAMLRDGTKYVDPGQDYYEQQYRQRVVKNLSRRARDLGYQLVRVDGSPQATLP